MATRRPSSPRPRAATALRGIDVTTLSFGNQARLRTQVAKVKPADAKTLVAESMRSSPLNAELLAHALITPKSAKPAQAEVKACLAKGSELMKWAAGARSEERRLVVRAFGRASQKMELLSGIGQLPRTQSRSFMKDYIDADGDLGTVADWLGEAGAILAVARGQGALVDGWLGDAWNSVKKGASTVAGAVGSAVNTVIDGIETAGKSLGQILGAAAHWTADRVQHLVTSLIEAGKKVLDILEAAARYGTELVRGAVAGLLAAGQSLRDVVSWAAGKAFHIAVAAIDAALDLGRTVLQVMNEAVALAANTVKIVVRAILQSGRKAAEILAAVASRTASIVRTVLEGLIAGGIHLVEVVAGVCRNVAEGFRKGFIQGLIAIGKGAAEIFLAALESGLAIAALAFAAILEALGGHRGLMPNELAEARKVFGWSIDLSRVKIARASYAADLITAVNGGRAFTTMYVLNFSSKNDFKANGELKSLPTLIHELTHVWQGVQDGPIYMIQALEQQIRHGSGAYGYTEAELAANGGKLQAFGREAQAQLVQDYYTLRYQQGRPEADWTRLQPYAIDVYKSKPIISLPLRNVVLQPIGATSRVTRPSIAITRRTPKPRGAAIAVRGRLARPIR